MKIEELNHLISNIWYSDLKSMILSDKVIDPYLGLRICRIDFNRDCLKTYDIEYIQILIMYLLNKYGYHTLSETSKFTISYVIIKNNIKIPFTKGNAILFRKDNVNLPVYNNIEKYISLVAEEYKDSNVLSIILRIYLHNINPGCAVNLSDDSILMSISSRGM